MKIPSRSFLTGALAFCAAASLSTVVAPRAFAGDSAYDYLVDTTDSALIHYGMDETSGTTAHDSGSLGYNGTYGSGTTLGQATEPGLGTSVANSAPGTTTGYTIDPGATTFPISTGDFTAEAWFDTSTTNPYQQLIFDVNRLNTGYDAGFDIAIQNHDTLVVGDNEIGNSNEGDDFSFGITTNTEYLVDFVRSGGLDSFYVDGTLIYQSPLTYGAGNTTFDDTVDLASDWEIGSQPNSVVAGITTSATTSEFNGTIDDVAVYGTGLTAAQVAADYAAGIAPAAAPEPSTWALMLLGAGVLGFVLRRRLSAAL